MNLDGLVTFLLMRLLGEERRVLDAAPPPMGFTQRTLAELEARQRAAQAAWDPDEEAEARDWERCIWAGADSFGGWDDDGDSGYEEYDEER